MPSPLHEALVAMFRDRPELVAEVLTGPLGIPAPTGARARAAPNDLTELAPAEYRADTVIAFGGEEEPELAVIVEVQLHTDNRKRRSWPAYVANLYGRLGCPVRLLVICPDPAVAAWCQTPIPVDGVAMVLRPLVFGPQQAPHVTDPAEAERHPNLTVLAALTRGGRPDPVPGLAALLTALDNLEHDHAALYADLILSALPPAAREHLEKLMSTTEYRYQSDFARRYFSAGEAQGEARGEARGEAKAILAVLDTRGIPLPDDLREQITNCTDLTQLDTWIRRAATARSADDLLAE